MVISGLDNGDRSNYLSICSWARRASYYP